MARPKLLPDNFTLSLVATVILASFFPCTGSVGTFFNQLTNVAIGLLFFLHGAKLSREAVVAGVTHWRLHALVMVSTFIMFPLIGLVLRPILSPLVTPTLYAGVLFLCALPSTVQSSIAFTSMAKGNVPAAVCSASASSLIGIFLTPLIAGIIITPHAGSGGSSFHSIWTIVLELLVPFVAGQLLRPVIGGWVDAHKSILKYVDQSSILLVVYTAFSEAVGQGLWHQIPLRALGGLLVVNAVLLAVALLLTAFVAKRGNFSRADQITIIFCGSKKSLASGVPMAKVMFSSQAVGQVVLPLMLFHQIQLMTCAILAQRWGARDTSGEGGSPVSVAQPAGVTAGVTNAGRPIADPARRGT